MAYPPAYTRAYSFTDWETLHPADPKPGPQLDAEYDAVSNALTATQTNLALIQRADGALANDSVGEDQLQDGIFDGIVDGITDDAEAAADAAAASAAAAASSAAAASADAALSLTSRNESAGFAAQAGVSQGIAQDSANAADISADLAFDHSQVAANAGNEAQGFRNEAEGFQELAFDWAEKLEGPVMPAPPGWPEAVDDGMFSSKWWAIRAREYNETQNIDLGPAGADIGEAFDAWDAIPGNDLGLGRVFATWGTQVPPHTYVLTDPSNPSDPDSWTDMTGGPGPPNILSIGTVITGAPGSVADVTVTGTSPAQVLNFTIPRGDVGPVGPQGVIGPVGPPNVLNVGTVTTGAAGSSADVTITGTSPTQTINFTIPRGDQGIQGPQGIQGIQGPPGNAGTVLSDDSNVTGDWVFNPTQFFNFTPAEVTAIKANAGLFDPTDAIQSNVRTRLARVGNPHSLYFQRVNGSFAAPTGILADEQLGTLQYAGWTSGGVMASATRISGHASENFTASAAGADIRIEVTPIGSLARIEVARFRGDRIDHYVQGRFTATGALSPNGSSVKIEASPPYFEMQNTGAAANGGRWINNLTSTNWQLFATDDAGSVANIALRAVRTAGTANLTGLEFGNSTNNPTFTFVGSGTVTSGGVFRAPDGAVGAPAYSFANDPDTGLYRPGADQLAIAANATQVLLVVGRNVSAMTLRLQDGQMGVTDGTAAAPAYSWLADPDTGIYRSGSDVIAFATGGSRVAQIYAGGIQILSPTGVLYLQDGTVAAPALTFFNDTDTGIYRQAGDLMTLVAGGVGLMNFMGPSATGLPRVSMSRPLSLTSGTAAVPGLFFESDIDSGFFLYADGYPTIAATGSASCYFTASAIYAGMYGSASGPAWSFVNDSDTGLYRAGADQLNVTAGAAARAYFQTGANPFGIYGNTGTAATGSCFMAFNRNTGVRKAYVGYGDSNTDHFYVANEEAGGALLFQTVSVTRATIDSSGVTAVGFQVSSSRTLKRETGRVTRAADILSRLRPVLYRLLANEDAGEQLGLIAEEVHELCPQLSDGKSVMYDRLALLLLADWQESRAAA